MSSKKEIFPEKVFTSLQELLRFEHIARGFSFLARNHKVRSIMGGKHASKLRGRGLDFEEVRNYVAGDDIRNIDWKVTAKTQKTHTRVYSEEKEKPALIVVDQSKSMFFGSVNKTKSVVAAELASIAAFRIQKEGDRVGGLIFADKEVDIIYPKRNRKNILHFLEKLVERNHDLKDSTITHYDDNLKLAFNKVKNIVTHDFLIVVISDFHRYSPDVIKFITRLSKHNDVLLAKIYDPLEQEIPDTNFIVGDGKQQLSVNATSKKLRNNYNVTFNDEFEAFKVQMKKHKIPLFLINTVEDVDVQLKELVGGRK